jgi:antitoxin HicB
VIFAYPARLTPDSGGFVVTFPDVPEAHTQGGCAAEALAEAVDALVAALGIYVEQRRALPRPSRPKRGQRLVALPSLVAAKAALYRAMGESRISNVALARRLGLTENAVRRLIDPDHRSHIGQIEAALAALGKHLRIEVRDAA